MSIYVVPFIVCLVLRSLRFTACRVFSDCISLGVKQVAERLGITSGGLLNLKLPEPDAMIGRTRGWLSDVFCQVVIGQCGVSFPSEKAVGFSPVRNWPVIARVLLFHCIRA